MSNSQSTITRREFTSLAAVAALTTYIAPRVFAQDNSESKRLVLGKDEHRYQVIHDWLKPPKTIAWGDTHGLCQDRSGRIYVAHTVHASSDEKNAVLVFDADGKYITSWGEEFQGGAHGLDIRKEGTEEFLYHCDIKRRLVVKTTLEGEVIWQQSYPQQAEVYASIDHYRPTNVAFAPNGDFYVGDGYGSSYIHRYSKDGKYITTIATPGSDKGQVSCPHGLWVDERSGTPLLAVADRSNARIQYLTLDGKHHSFVTEGIRKPCHFKTRGELMLVPDLDSVVTLLDKNNKVIAHLGDGYPSKLRGAPRKTFIPGKFIHPHDAIFLHTGDILVAEWVPIGRITLLRKVV